LGPTLGHGTGYTSDMFLAAVCLQASLLAHPLYLQEEKPELRSAQHILLLHDDVEDLPFKYGRSKEDSLELMRSLAGRFDAGEDFAELASQHSDSRTRAYGGSLGSYPPGMLKEPINSFLFGAEMGEVSPILDTPSGLHLVVRVDTHAAVRQILVSGTGVDSKTEAERLLNELREGADFAELAAQHSKDPISAANGGCYRVFERGSHDALIKAAAFRAQIGELVGPIESPLGFHLLERVSTDGFPKELWEDNFIRVRVMLVSHLNALGASPHLNRTQSEALALGEEAVRRLDDGEDFAELAGRFNDDPGGKKRRGDVGWIHRQNPDLPVFYSKLFLVEPGTVSGPILTRAGVVVARRER
jgi:parvulin-like peptidyl-prolyl isomerase